MKVELHTPTVEGRVNALNLSIPLSKRFAGTVTQVGTGNPVISEQINELSFTPNFVRIAKGVYTITEVGAFTIAKFGGAGVMYAVESDGAGLQVRYKVLARLNDDSLGLTTKSIQSEGVGVDCSVTTLDDLLVNDPISFELINDLSTVEKIFDEAILQLDANQLLLWDKIVIRDNGTVTEVSGSDYRRTSNYSLSSKLINS